MQDRFVQNDGTAYTMGELLPSAYFYIEKSYDNNGESGDNLKKISVHGAGLGHGCGMSQNGAKCLAERGLTAEQILAYYYNGGIKAVDMLENTADDVEGAIRDVNLYKIYRLIKEMRRSISEAEVGTYASGAAFFFVFYH